MFARRIPPAGLLLVLAGCFNQPKIDVGSLKCKSEQNCPTGYQCLGATATALGSCAKSASDGGGTDGPVGGGGGGLDSSPIDGRKSEAGGAMDGAPGADAGEGSTGVDGPTSANDDVARIGDDAVGDVPAGAEAGTDVPITGNGGAGGAGGGGASGGGGAVAGSGGMSGSGGTPGTGTGGAASGGVTSGGTVGTGGVVSGGGSSGSGGVVASGGVSSTGGTTVVIDCGPLTKPDNGAVSYSATTVGNTAEYTCTSGFGPSGSSTRYCLASGNWSGVAPTCVPANCPGLPSPQNGLVSAPTLTYNSTASYTCSDGYQLTGVATRTCQADGTWSGLAPTCPPVDCGGLTDPANGRVNATSTTFNSNATYLCDTGYKLSDSSARTCQANKQWSGSAPTCAIVDCGAPPAFNNGSVSASVTTYQAIATYTCSQGFTMTGDNARTCEASGSWSGTAPTCCLAGQVNCGGVCTDVQGDSGNCGGCGAICTAVAPSTAQCLSGRCLTTLAPAEISPRGIALDATNVYWTRVGTSAVVRMPLIGGSPVVLLQQRSQYQTPYSIAVDANNVYWSYIGDAGSAGISPPGVARASLPDGSLPVTIQAGSSLQTGLAMTSSAIYWTISKNDGTGNYYVYKALLGGSSATSARLFTGIVWSIGASSSNVYAAGELNTNLAMALVNVETGQVVASGTSVGGQPAGLAVDSGSLYWIDLGTRVLLTVPLTGGTPRPLTSGLSPSTNVRIAVDGSSLYWANKGDILKMPLSGGTPTPIASNQNSPADVVVDAESVYWINSGGPTPGSVMKLTPK